MVAPFRILIPARYGSSRLPGKPLRIVAGKPLIQRVLERATECGAQEVLVATDDPRIAETVQALNGQVCMTGTQHATGTDRLAEVARERAYIGDEILVNLQGDEPGIPADLPGRLATALSEHPSAGIATLATPIRNVDDLFDPNIVKVVCDGQGLARYFSRAPIPWVRDSFGAGRPDALPSDVVFLRHIGIYAYRCHTLKKMASWPQSALEGAEALEQLRALEQGVDIHVSVLPEAPAPGVDTEEDLVRLEQYLTGAA